MYQQVFICDDTQYSQRNVRSEFRCGTIDGDQIVQYGHHYDAGDLGDEVGNTEGADRADGLPLGLEISLFKPDGRKVETAPDVVGRIQRLSDDSGPSCAFHSPMEHKDEHRIQDNIGDASDQKASHALLWPTVRADHVAKGTVNGGERKTQYNDPSIGIA